MKILLLGANGQLGSDVLRVNASLQTPHDITAWKRAECDVANTASLYALLKTVAFDVLVNCTSYHQTEQVEENSALAFAINAFAVREMARAAADKKALFVHISTDYVFGAPIVRHPLTEEDKPGPLNVYGASKLMGESLAQAVYDHVLILRVASLFGLAGASGKGGNFIESILKQGREKGQLRVVCDQWMTPTSTVDVAKILFLLLKAGIDEGVYHAVNRGSASWYELASQAITLCGVEASVEPILAAEYPFKAMRPAYCVLSNAKAQAIVGAIPSWQQALQTYLVLKGHVVMPGLPLKNPEAL